MKFAQYLQDTQTPEWKRAYIDYRGLKKRITAIRKSQQGLNIHVADVGSSDSPDDELPAAPRPSNAESEGPRPSLAASSERAASYNGSNMSITSSSAINVSSASMGRPSKERKLSLKDKIFPTIRSIAQGKSFSSRMRSNGGSKQVDPLAALPLHELLTQLSPVEVSFFTLLDTQLDKVESFYLTREKEMISRGRMLQSQLNELRDHRKLFHQAHRKMPWAAKLGFAIKVQVQQTVEDGDPGHPTIIGDSVRTTIGRDEFKGKSARRDIRDIRTFQASSSAIDRTTSAATAVAVDHEEAPLTHSPSEEHAHERLNLSSDPDSYLYAKRKLKRAVLEHYRGLELLHNYRILNMTGFRKALKKFEKVTKIPVQNQYMTNKVEKSAFASDKTVLEMMSQMEELYAAAFSRGDKKKATRRLRAGNVTQSHHFSSFRSGLYLGLAIPAIVDGFVKAFSEYTDEEFPAWKTLLFLYSILFVPVLFSALVGLNLVVWARTRINYVFIFELDVLNRMDYREYFEIPCLLLATLAYAFWLSFSLVGHEVFPPTIWPLVWLGFAFVVIFDPLPLQYRSSRFWLVRNIIKQFLSGTRRVEFTDFWMGDQFCSLVFTLSNLYWFSCVYANDFPSDPSPSCGLHTNMAWGVGFALAALPFVIRLVQSIKRYVDSSLITHLVNAGKYATGIITYFLYFYWRHTDDRGHVFAWWMVLSTFNSIYACSWDFLMDWSLFRINDVKYKLLRKELVYTNHVYMYYIALVTNAILRFTWVIYIPKQGPDMMLRAFIAGLVEMLRRWQWNFYRLENEHLGNMDQYRVTREVPLPYILDDTGNDDGDDDDKDMRVKRL